MQINGKEIDFKISRLEDAGKMEIALQHMKEKENSIKSLKKLTEIIPEMIVMFRVFFQEATGEDIIGECTDLNEAKETYMSFLKEVNKQKNEVLTFTLDDIK